MGRLCREFDNFDGMLIAKIPSMYSIAWLLYTHKRKVDVLRKQRSLEWTRIGQGTWTLNKW